jgi:hypothetical protein
MRTTLALDDELLAKAQALTGVSEKSRLVREALKALSSVRARAAWLGLAAANRRSGRHPAGGRGASDPCRYIGLGRTSQAPRSGPGGIARGRTGSDPSIRDWRLALGNLSQRAVILGDLASLPHADVANDSEVLHFIGRRQLHGRGIGYLDAHLLVSAQLTPNAAQWTRNKRLLAVATTLSLAAPGVK